MPENVSPTGILLFNGVRRSGKTYKLVQWLKQDPQARVIFCQDHHRARHLKHEYGLKDSQLEYPRPGSDRFRGRNAVVAFDDAERLIEDLLLRYLSAGPNVEIGAITTYFDALEENIDKPATHDSNDFWSTMTGGSSSQLLGLYRPPKDKNDGPQH